MDNDNETKARRERIATAVLAGWMGPDVPVSPARAALEAVKYADALIAELDKEPRR